MKNCSNTQKFEDFHKLFINNVLNVLIDFVKTAVMRLLLNNFLSYNGFSPSLYNALKDQFCKLYNGSIDLKKINKNNL